MNFYSHEKQRLPAYNELKLCMALHPIERSSGFYRHHQLNVSKCKKVKVSEVGVRSAD